MKSKFKINELAAKPQKIELEHPTVGETGIFVEMVGPYSKQFRKAIAEYNAIESPNDEQKVTLFVGCMLGWDEESFEMPFSPEAAQKFFMQPENEWIIEFLVPIARDASRFFHNKSPEAQTSVDDTVGAE